ncbi:hypothetical protein [Halococcus salsus]|uniref:hypothetical protein n=1 Tax=Halococcus salsus TaxID=2162894 RepID=UPI0013578D79|nr:hypothetical protein [Halococcus salsus]
MSISTDGGSDDAQLPNCPDCETTLHQEIITEDGTEDQTTEYMGWWCPDCANGMVACEHCESFHSPDTICEAKRDHRRQLLEEDYGGVALVRGFGYVPIEECDTNEQGCKVFRGGECESRNCDGERIVVLQHNEDYLEKMPPMAEYTPVDTQCSNFDRYDADSCNFYR